MVSSLKKVLCGLLVLNGATHAAVQLSPYCPIKRIDGLQCASWQKAGMKSATNLAGTAALYYVSQKVIGDGSGKDWYNGPVAAQLSQAMVAAGVLGSIAPLASELNTDLGNEISQLSVDVPMTMVAGMIVNKSLDASAVKLTKTQQVYARVGTLATFAALRKAGKFAGKYVS